MMQYFDVTCHDDFPMDEEILLVFENKGRHTHRIGMCMESPSGRRVVGVLGGKNPQGTLVAYGMFGHYVGV
jgi:hypothetical protein